MALPLQRLARLLPLLLLLARGAAQTRPWNLEDDYTTSTAAGGARPGFEDGSLANASLSRPEAVAIDPVAQVLYVADRGNHAIRCIRVSALLHVQDDDVDELDARNLSVPAAPPAMPTAPAMPPGEALNAAADDESAANTSTTRRLSESTGGASATAGATVDASGEATVEASVDSSDYVTTMAGGSGRGFADGYGAMARFDTPSGVAVDGYSGLLFVADTGNAVIREIDLRSGRVTTLAGSPGVRGFVNGRGRAAAFNSPVGVAFALRSRQLFVCDAYNHAIRVVHVLTREVKTLAGSGMQGSDDGPGYIATFHLPSAAVVDDDEAILYVVDASPRVRMMPTQLEPTYWPEGAPPPPGVYHPSPPPFINFTFGAPPAAPGEEVNFTETSEGINYGLGMRRLSEASAITPEGANSTNSSSANALLNVTMINGSIAIPMPPLPPIAPPSMPPAPGFGDIAFTTEVSTLFDGGTLGLQELGGIATAYGWPGGALMLADTRGNKIYRLGLGISPSPPPPVIIIDGNGTSGNGTGAPSAPASGNSSAASGGADATGTGTTGRRLQTGYGQDSSDVNATNATQVGTADTLNATLANATLLNATDASLATAPPPPPPPPACVVNCTNATAAPPPPSLLGCDVNPPGPHCIVCAQGVMTATAPYECHPLLVLLAGDTPGFLDGVGIRPRFYRPFGLSVESSTRRVYLADSYNHRVRVLDLTDVPDEYVEDVEEWYEVLARALRQNLVFIIILCGSSLLLCFLAFVCCRYFPVCPLYQKRLHQKRMKSMDIGNRA